jgi:hypothetical protein
MLGLIRSKSFEMLDFFNKMHPKFCTIKMFFFPIELDAVFGALFLLGFAAFLEKRMLKALIYRDTEVRIENQDLM